MLLTACGTSETFHPPVSTTTFTVEYTTEGKDTYAKFDTEFGEIKIKVDSATNSFQVEYDREEDQIEYGGLWRNPNGVIIYVTLHRHKSSDPSPTE